MVQVVLVVPCRLVLGQLVQGQVVPVPVVRAAQSL
jgi:hypothetical protein